MSNNGKIVKIYMIPLEFPCGPQSSCCGPIGQSDEEIQGLKDAIEKELNLDVEVINLRETKLRTSESHLIRLINTFGPMGLPLITLDGQVVSIGNPSPHEAVQTIRQKLIET